MTPGQIAYAKDVAQRPLYHDGSPRKAWENHTDAIRSWWETLAARDAAAANAAKQ